MMRNEAENELAEELEQRMELIKGLVDQHADTQANQSTSAAQLNTELAAALPIANGKEA